MPFAEASTGTIAASLRRVEIQNRGCCKAAAVLLQSQRVHAAFIVEDLSLDAGNMRRIPSVVTLPFITTASLGRHPC
jgi:hypothetical protein